MKKTCIILILLILAGTVLAISATYCERAEDNREAELQAEEWRKRADELTAFQNSEEVSELMDSYRQKYPEFLYIGTGISKDAGILISFQTWNNPFEDEQETANMLFPEIRDALLSLAVENGINIEPITYSCLWGVVVYSAIQMPEILS